MSSDMDKCETKFAERAAMVLAGLIVVMVLVMAGLDLFVRLVK